MLRAALRSVRCGYNSYMLNSCSRTMKSDATQTTFGFDPVKEEDRQEKVNEVFNRVAKQYDCMNDLMSAGLHRLWKDDFVTTMNPLRGMRCLDVAGGTGDIAMRIMRHAEKSDASIESGASADKPVQVTVCDINAEMLKVGKDSARRAGVSIDWVEGNAEKLPFEDGTFDMYTIAFGLRNCTHLDRVLREAHRVLKPYGRFGCLEFSPVENPILSQLYDTYSFNVIPVLGELVAGDWHSYRYLAESIRVFPNQQALAKLIRQSGFTDVRVDTYALGIVRAHIAWKLK